MYLPVVTGSTLEFAAVSADSPLQTNRFGIDEPAAGSRVPPDALELVVVPLVAFDQRGHRLGHGHGYYDRAFAFRLHGDAPPLLIGYAYDEQEIARVHDHEADVALDAVVTPTRIVWTPGPGAGTSD